MIERIRRWILRRLSKLGPNQSEISVQPVQDGAKDLILDSELFNAGWYARTNRLRDLHDPLIAVRHYMSDGWKEGRDPSLNFSVAGYLSAYPDVKEAGIEPLSHYLAFGRSEGRSVQVDPRVKAVGLSGLFDENWYRRKYGLGDDENALNHYCFHGWRQQLDPGPFFDIKTYLEANADIRNSGLEPVGHFQEHGRSEGRRIGRKSAVNQEDQLLLDLNCVDPAAVGSVIVVVHAYYIELLGEIFVLLKNVPVRFTLCIAVTNADCTPTVKNLFDSHAINANLLCRVGQNRGRNFGTMLSEFSAEIEQHDFILHLHTKRSLYTGREQNEWRDSLYSALAGSRTLVSGILNLFSEDPKIGLIYPTIFSGMPYWAHHWLSNSDTGAALLHSLGIKAMPSGYFDFPVGGMFWARVEALRPLFAARLTYLDFEPESGQTDGTKAHAIERAIGVISASRGYDFVEIEYESGFIRKGWSHRNISQYIHQNEYVFSQLISNVDLVSFDIFDTLIVRPSLRPDSIIEYAGYRISKSKSGDNFFRHRKEAEFRARKLKNFEGDVDIVEIYAAFPREDGWTDDRVNRAMEIELELDLAVVRQRPDVMKLVTAAKKHGCRIVAITDTYLPPKIIRAALDRCGFSSLIDELYVSNDRQMRKDRGDMWTGVAASEGVTSERWLHVGDNEHSDIQAACDRGLKYFHVMNPTLLARLKGFDPRSPDGPTPWSSDLVIGPAILKLAGSPFFKGENLKVHRLETAKDVGYVVFGPIVYTFIAWIISHPAKDLIQKIYFLSREGYMLQKAYAVVRDNHPDLQLPESFYLLTSRRAALGASQAAKFSPGRVASGGGGFRGTFQKLLESRLGFDLKDDVLGSWPVRLPDDERQVKAALKTLRQSIISQSSDELQTYRKYLEESGMHQNGVFGLVDVGYSGTIQKSLQDIVGATFAGFYMATAPDAAFVEEGDGFAFACFSQEVDQRDAKAAVMRHSIVMEAFMTAPSGQFIRFTSDGPVSKPSTASRTQVGILHDLHSGAIDYVSELLTTYGPDLLSTVNVNDQVQKFLEMFCSGEIDADAEILEALQVEDDYSGSVRHEPLKRSTQSLTF